MNLSEARKQAWATRRAKYGPKGHNRYTVTLRTDPSVVSMRALIAKLTNEGVLSEGQACKATGLHRIELRTLCDSIKEQP